MSDVTTTKFDRFRNHLEKNKTVYIVGATCLAAGVVVGAALVRTSGNISVTGDVTGDVISVTGKSNTVNKIVVEFVERSTASKPVHLVGTNLYFNSLSEAARETGHHLSMISKNVNGLIADVKGDVFEFLELAG